MPDVNQVGETIVRSVREFVARSVASIEARLDALEARPVAEKGERGADGQPGSNGRDGIDGAPGERGADGRSVSLEEIEAMMERRLELKFAAYVVEHERRLPEVLQRMIDQIEKPKDGRDGLNGKDGTPGRDGKDGTDGKDGADGFDLRHFDVIRVDERTFTLRFKDLLREKSHTITLPVPIGRGIWREDKAYSRGDIVTWGGSSWELEAERSDGKPGDNGGNGWRLVVKRGRDGKDGERGEKGDTGKAGRNGRDLTQMGADGSKW